ncbi:unnamed protein product, partial [Brenthis ino]
MNSFSVAFNICIVEKLISSNQHDVSYIEDPGAFPAVLIAQEAPGPVQRACNPVQCARLCHSLGFRLVCCTIRVCACAR